MLFQGKSRPYLIGPSDERWDMVLLVRHRSAQDFLAFASNEAYLAQRGRDVVAGQRYEVRSAIASGDTVAMEIDWSATLRVPVATLAAGDVMRAAFAVFLTFRDGRICAQRNYDCFEPF